MNKEEIKHLSQSYYDLHKKYYILKDNWNKLKEYIKQEPTLYFYNDKLPFEIIVEGILNKMKELERGVIDVED